MKEYGEWVFRSILLLAVGIQLYLTQSFVTRKEYKEDQNANAAVHLSIQTSVNDIAATIKIMASTSVRVEDHELRLRLVEQRQISNITRVETLERELMSRGKP